MKYLLVLPLLFGLWVAGVETFTFPSADNLPITADYYPVKNQNAAMLILCHQAGWSRGEYSETAGWFNQMGFQVLAIDQRSGGEVNQVSNQTHARAVKKGLATGYLDAKQDIEAAVRYAQKTYKPKATILVGSSYSAALVVRILAEGKFSLKAGLAFSPGEYFSDKTYLTSVCSQIGIPLLITSARNEDSYWKGFAAKVPSQHLTTFLPNVKGDHGSRALWSSKKGHKLYREAVQRFLLPLR